MTTVENIKLTKKDKTVLTQLCNLVEMNITDSSCLDSCVQTRAIADACDINIYSARYSLLKLVQAGFVESCNCSELKGTYWKINMKKAFKNLS